MKIYQIKCGYQTVGSFDNISLATEFFASLVKGGGKTLCKAESKDKVAHYWGGEIKFSLEIKDVELYLSKKEAEFAIYQDGESISNRED